MAFRRSGSGAVWAIPAILVSGLYGCQTETSDSSSSRFQIRDSAGIRVVSYETDLDAAPVKVQLVYQHGEAAAHYEFGRIFDGALRDDGGAVVSDLLNDELVVVDSTGASARVLARSGEGPSELRGAVSVHVVDPDTIWAEDDRNAKVMLFVDGSFVRSISTQGDPSLNQGLLIEGLDGEGRFLMSTSAYDPNFEVPWLPGHMVVWDPSDDQLDSVGTYDLAPRRTEPLNPFRPFGVITAGDGEFIDARIDRPELRWTRPDGTIRQIVRWVPDLSYPTDADWEQFVAATRESSYRLNPRMSRELLDESTQRQLEGMEVDPEVPLPLFGVILGGESGSVWMADFTPGPGRDPSRYRVVSSDGEWSATVEFPSPFHVLDVRGDLVLGVLKNEFDVQSVAVFRMDSARP